MIAYFGKTIYYRCCNKERLIKPKEQKYIQELFERGELQKRLNMMNISNTMILGKYIR